MADVTKDSFFLESHGKLLTISLSEREYGIPILEAREVVGMQNIDPVPRTPEFMKGVINLRGKIVPVIDLRLKFGMSEKDVTKETCIVVVDIKGKMTGIIVDQLVGVVTVNEDEYESKPSLGHNINADFVAGMVKLDERVIIVLEVEKILGNDELCILENTDNSENGGNENE